MEEKKTLLIGDSCLQEIKASDLNENVLIRTLPEANVSLIKSWIREKLEHPLLSECIIYGGAQDLLGEGEVSETIFDEIGEIITELKNKNEDVNIKICELVPSVKSADISYKINDYNSKLLRWCEDNGIVYVKTENYLRLGTGDIDETCYNNKDYLDYDNLSRIGAVRLLEAITSACQSSIVRENWKETKWDSLKPLLKKSTGRKRSVIEDVRKNERNFGNQTVRKNRYFRYENDSYVTHSAPFRRQPGNDDRNQGRPPSIRNRQGIDTYDNFRYYPPRDDFSRNRTIQKRGCYNCGEFNHRQSNCRYDHKLKCNNCFEYGHKSKLCSIVHRD